MVGMHLSSDPKMFSNDDLTILAASNEHSVSRHNLKNRSLSLFMVLDILYLSGNQIVKNVKIH